MDTNTDTRYTRSAALSDKQRGFLSKFIIDPAVQRLIPSSVVGESVNITTTTVGLLLTHQPLVARFHHKDYNQVSRLISGREKGYVKIFPSDYDYDLTHTLYYVPEGSSDKSIATSDLNIPGVELSGVCTFAREEMSAFLEKVHGCCAGSRAVRITSLSDIVEWLGLESPRRDYFEPVGLCLDGLDEGEYVGSLRMECSLHLDSPRDIWIRHVGMDWPEFFFGRA